MTTEAIAGAGDSVTLGVRPGVTEAQTYLSLMAYRFNRPYVNYGVGGDTSTQGRNYRFAAIISTAPKYITIMYGINDWFYSVPVTTYKDNLAWMIDQARSIGAIPILFTPSMVRDAAFQAGMPPYVQACRELKAEKSVALIDVYAMFCEGSVYPGGSSFESWYADVQHPGATGHAKIDALIGLPQNAGVISHFTPQTGGEMFVVFNGNNGSIYRKSAELSGLTVERLATGRYRLNHFSIGPDVAIAGSPTPLFGGARMLYAIDGTRQNGSIEVGTVRQDGIPDDYTYISVFIA